MICKKCKQELPDDAVICKNCGQVIEENMEKKVREKEKEIQSMEEEEREELSIEELLREPLPTDFKVVDKVPYRQSKQYEERKRQVRKTIIMTGGMLAATVAVAVGTFFLVKNVVMEPDSPFQVSRTESESNGMIKTATSGNSTVTGKNPTEKLTEEQTQTDKPIQTETQTEKQTETKAQTEKETQTETQTEKKQVGSVTIQVSARAREETERVAPVTIKKEPRTKETQEPETEAQTNPPETNPPETYAPETDPPQTYAPETDPPETYAPETDPPQTNPPETDPPETYPPETDPPETYPPETDGYEPGWEEPEEPIYSGGGYILPSSSSEILTRDSLIGMSLSDLYLARNEIFARHGRMFDDEWLQSYFNSQSWYQPLYSPSEFVYDWLSSIEMQNVNTILEYEAELGA